jgi:hypothetical protein
MAKMARLRARSLIALLPFVACARPPQPGPPAGSEEPAGRETLPATEVGLDRGADAGLPKDTSSWHLIVDSALPELAVAPFDRFVAITSRSLFVIVDGDRVTQEPRFLRGFPEWINWDARVGLGVPAIAKLENGLPLGTERWAHAGNRHGPDVAHWWTKSGWSTTAPKPDPRLSKLPKPTTLYGDSIQRALPTGELVVVRYEAEIEAFVISASGGATQRTVVPSAAGIRHVVLGDKPDDLYLCETSQGLLHFDGKQWSSVETERTPSSCARTTDGVLWLVVDARGSLPDTLISRGGSAWNEVPLPADARPEQVFSSGNRVWVVASKRDGSRFLVYSNQPVVEPVSFDEKDLPGPLWINGITGLDVTSVDVVSVSATPAGPGTSACTSLVVWVGPKLTPELEKALGTPRPRVIETAGIVPGSIAPHPNGSSQMQVVPSGKTRKGVSVLPKNHADGVELVKRVRTALPSLDARLLCAEPRIVRDL